MANATVTLNETVQMETIKIHRIITMDTQDLKDIAVESAFPQCGISQAPEGHVGDYEWMMATVQNGKAYSKWWIGQMLAGSRMEGLAMDDHWGHGETDWDYMNLFGDHLGVNVTMAGGQQPRGKSCLDFRPEGCPAAYTKLEVMNPAALRKYLDWIENIFHISGNQCWLDTHELIQGIPVPGSTVSGPAAQVDSQDIVSTLVCNRPHPDLHLEFSSRPRQWPLASLISVILKLPMLLVLVGHKLSPEYKLQARISWSLLEVKLIRELPENVRQGYIACKYVLKRFLKAPRGLNEIVDGRSKVSSYHIKTAFLRYLEKTPSSTTTSPFVIFSDLLRELDGYLKVGNLPHYFLSQCNLLETIADDELCVTRQVIGEIISNPLNALLTSPTDPQQIYGQVHPNHLVFAFRKVSSHPMCKQSQQELSELLARVDERRRQTYKEQLESDERKVVYGRTDLIGLVDTLKQMKHI